MIFLVPLSFLLFLLFFLVLIFFLFVVIPAQAVRIALEKLGLSGTMAFVILLASLVGSFVNIPVAVKTTSGFVPAFSYFSGFVYDVPEGIQVIAINFGGAIVPICLCIYLFFRAPLFPTVFATIISTVLCYNLGAVVPGVGVKIPAFIPPLAAVVLAFIFSPKNKIPVAYISGVMGVLIGADLLNLSNLGNFQGMMSIGGAGVYDGIFLVGIFSALLA